MPQAKPKKKIKLNLHGNVIRNSPGRYVAYFDEFPEMTAQGATESQTKERLVHGLMTVLKMNKKLTDDLKEKNKKKSPEIKRFELSGNLSAMSL